MNREIRLSIGEAIFSQARIDRRILWAIYGSTMHLQGYARLRFCNDLKENGMKNKVLVILFVLLAAGCGLLRPASHEGDVYALEGRWLEAVAAYRKSYQENPTSIELKSKLEQARLDAAEFYYDNGAKLLADGNFDQALVEFQRGLVAMPGHEKLRHAFEKTLTRKRAEENYREAVAFQTLGRDGDAMEHLNVALDLDPDHDAALALFKGYEREKEIQDSRRFLTVESDTPVSLNFDNADLKDVFGFLSDSFGVNIIFDEAVKNIPVTIYAKFVTFEQALNLILTTTKTFYKKIGPNTILIAPDTLEKHGEYEDYIVRTFYLKSVPAENIGLILKETLDLKKIVINETLNSMIIRDTEEVLALIEKIIVAHDREPAEVILEVEILEVNRTKSEQLGLDFGSQITVDFPNFIIDDADDFARNVLLQGTVTLPSVILRYFKQDVDAEILANPRIRTLDGEVAKIHIGDRVPLRSSTIQDATGQTRTTFEYRDIGIRLEVEPFVHVDNSVTVHLNLEVSSLGQNLGTLLEPAFSIGTRNVNTVMLLRDGETAILGGLIRDEDRKSHVKLPGLGDVPALGRLFTSTDDQINRTDVLLTITPRIVRPWQLASKSDSTMFSGTRKHLTTRPKFAFMKKGAASSEAPEIKLNLSEGGAGRAAGPAVLSRQRSEISLDASGAELSNRAELSPKSAFSFSEPLYNAGVGEEVTITLVARNLGGVDSIPLEVKYNPALMNFVSGAAGGAVTGETVFSADADKGIVRIELSDVTVEHPEGEAIAQLTFTAVDKGISYLLYKGAPITDRTGKTSDAQYKASRIVIR